VQEREDAAEGVPEQRHVLRAGGGEGLVDGARNPVEDVVLESRRAVALVGHAEVHDEDVEAGVAQGADERVVRAKVVDVRPHHQRRHEHDGDGQQVEGDAERVRPELELLVSERRYARERELAALPDDIARRRVRARWGRALAKVHEGIHGGQDDAIGYPARGLPWVPLVPWRGRHG
jgi:hypothetical protein